MELEELRNDEMITEWLENLSRENTREAYLQSIRQFTNFTGKTPDELISEAEDEIKDGMLMRRRSIKKYLISFKKHLQDKGAAEYTIKNRLGGVKAFYQFFDIEIPKLKRENSRPHTKVENLRIPTKDDFREILKVCSPLEKAIVLAGTSSGLAASDLCSITYKAFKDGYDPQTEITTLRVRRIKTQTDFITFFSPEASKAILDYLDYRNREPKTRKKEKMIALRKQRVTDGSYLFIKQLVSPEYDSDHDEETRKLTPDLINMMYRSIVERAGKSTGLSEWNYIRSHTARKFFVSTLLNAGADSFFTNYLAGHQLDQVQEAYFQGQPEKLKEIYIKFIPYLTIQKEIDISASPEFKNAIEERDHYKAMAEKYFINGLELIQARGELKKLKAKSMTLEETKAELLERAKNMEPKNENEMKIQAALKKMFDIE